MTPFYFVIAGLTCWRLASLCANEDGAFHMFRHFRTWAVRHTNNHPRGFLARFHFDEGLQCEWCNSVWIATAIVVIMGWHWLAIFALSAFAIVMKYVVQTLEQVREYYERLNTSLKDLQKLAKLPDPGYKPGWSEINRRADYVAERDRMK